jgi:pimeloyl-ACP methyl ester carboxylesterase
MSNPAVDGLTPESVASDLLAIADASGADRFAYYGYSWLALAGLQLALRTDRLWALAMGGYPPLDGPYRAMPDAPVPRTTRLCSHRRRRASP